MHPCHVIHQTGSARGGEGLGRCHIEELSQQLIVTCNQLVYIRKVLDHLVLTQTPVPSAPVVVPSTSTPSGSVLSADCGSHLPRQVASLSSIGLLQVNQTFQFIAQTNTALGSAPSPHSNIHLLRQVASAPSKGFSQASWAFQDQAQAVAF